MGRGCAARETLCPVTDDLSFRLLRLPFFNDLTEAEQSRVIAAVISFACRS
jgi:dTDP-4-amino-4,6-dideoxygalactose transaminase